MARVGIGGWIVGYMGRFGSGKTYSMTKNAASAVKHNRGLKVAANYHLYDTEYCQWPEWEHRFVNDVSQLTYLRDCLVLIDEASLWFDNRKYRDMGQDFVSWFLQARHHNVHIWFTSQHDQLVDAKIRRNTSVWFTHQRFGPWILQIGYDPMDGGRKFQTKWHSLRPKYWGLYNTHEVVGTADGKGRANYEATAADKRVIRQAQRSWVRCAFGDRVIYRQATVNDVINGGMLVPKGALDER